MKLTYKNTLTSCFIGYIVQAISVNFLPLLFITFQDTYHIPLQQITLLVTVNFIVQLVVDLLAERGIARTSWDYYASFGVFNKTPRGVRPQFPQDLNRPLLAALGFNADVE